MFKNLHFKKDQKTGLMLNGIAGLICASELPKFGGVFRHAVRRAGDDRPDDELEWIEDHNLVVNVGLQYLLNTGFHSVAQSTSWYLGIFGNNYPPVAADTSAVLTSSYGEYTSYSSATRPAWTASRTNQTSSNSASKASFVASGGSYPDTIYGAFLINNNTKGGTSGTLMAASLFSAARTLEANSDELIIQYDLTCTSS